MIRVLHNPREMDTGIFSTIRSMTLASRKTVAEIQRGVVLDHDPQAFRCRLVETVHAFDFLDQCRVQALRAAVVGAGHRYFGAASGNPAGGAIEAFDLGDHLFDRATGRSLNDDEVDDQDAEQGRDDQQQPSQNISQHVIAPRSQAWPDQGLTGSRSPV